MVDRPSRWAAGFGLALSMTAVSLMACGGAKPAPSPAASAEAVTLAPARPADAPAEIAPATSQGAPGSPAAAGAPGAPGAPAAAAPAAAASPSPSPTPDPEEAKRAEQEQRLKAEVAAAKARADSLTAQVSSECPDLKPGELRHPSAAARCQVLKDQAADAVRQYELGKREAQSAGITVQ